jgi:hypothetical protein
LCCLADQNGIAGSIQALGTNLILTLKPFNRFSTRQGRSNSVQSRTPDRCVYQRAIDSSNQIGNATSFASSTLTFFSSGESRRRPHASLCHHLLEGVARHLWFIHETNMQTRSPKGVARHHRAFCVTAQYRSFGTEPLRRERKRSSHKSLWLPFQPLDRQHLQQSSERLAMWRLYRLFFDRQLRSHRAILRSHVTVSSGLSGFVSFRSCVRCACSFLRFRTPRMLR